MNLVFLKPTFLPPLKNHHPLRGPWLCRGPEVDVELFRRAVASGKKSPCFCLGCEGKVGSRKSKTDGMSVCDFVGIQR